MNKHSETIWVTVHVERGFVSEICAYHEENAARRKERSWRRKINTEYDDTACEQVAITERTRPTRQLCKT